MLDDAVKKCFDAPLAGEAHRGIDRLCVDLLVRRALVEQAERVADSALGQPCDQLGRVAAQLKALLRSNMRNVVGQLGRLDAAEIMALAARKDRGGHLLQLGRGEDEDQMLGRLFDDLQQRIEGRDRKHMHLVDDIDALFYGRGREDGFLPQGADVVDAVVGGSVQLDHIEDRAIGDTAAGGAFSAGVAVHRVLAVDRAGEDARTGRFARSPRANKQIRVREPRCTHLVLQGLGDVLLADDVVKGLRPPFAVKRLIHALSS